MSSNKAPPGGAPGTPLEVVRVEDAGQQNPAAWEGIAAVDTGELPFSLSKCGILIGGDAMALLVFAIIGRINHGEILDLETLTTALPFWIGCGGAALLTGGYGQRAQYATPAAAAGGAAKQWALGTPIGLAIRGLQKGYMPPTPFIIVAAVSTAVLLLGWRAAWAAASQDSNAGDRKAASRSGGPLEFMSMLGSLTRRW